MTARSAIIEITFLDWWHAGTGQSGSGDADMICYRDAWGCPAMPMTQIKGILRETAETFSLPGLDPTRINQLFGERSEPGVTVDAAGAAIAFTGDACLKPEEREWFEANPKARGQLFGWLSSTRIDDDTGTAKAETLRSIEVCVPMTLSKQIDWVGIAEPLQDWIDQLDRICALTPVFGKQKNDGLGRAIARCKALKGGKT